MFVLVGRNQIAQRIQVQFFALIHGTLGEQTVHDPLGLFQVLVGLDRGEGESEHEFQVGVPGSFRQTELRLGSHVHRPLRRTGLGKPGRLALGAVPGGGE